jgi:iron complex outermembrane receptor protein
LKRDFSVGALRVLPSLLAAAGLLVLTPLAWASSSEKLEYQLPRGPLSATLKAIGEKTGVRIEFAPDAVAKLTAATVQGQFNAKEALIAALAGTGLAAVESADGTTIQVLSEKGSRSEAQQLASVTVTGARKVKEPAQRAPTSVSRHSGDDLENQHIDDIQDLQYVVPGLFVQSTESNDTQFTIRGLGDGGGQSSGEQNIGMPSSVSVFVDDVYYARPGIIRALSDIDYVDVYKGASGTSFGLNSVGGAIDIHTQEPSWDPEAQVSSSVGERGYFKTAAMLSGPVTDTVAYRFNVVRQESQGNIKNLTDQNWVNGYERNGVRGQVLVKPSNSFQFKLSADYSNEYANPSSVLKDVNPTSTLAKVTSQYALGGREVYLDDVTSTHTEQGGVAANALWSFDSGYKIRSITSYRQYRYSPSLTDNLSVRIYTNSGFKVYDHDISQELRLESPHGKFFDYSTGVAYYHQQQDIAAHTRYATGSTVTTYAGGSSFSGLDIIRYGELHDEFVSPYFRGTIHATEKLDAQFGLRANFEDKKARFIRYNKNPIDTGDLSQSHVLPQTDFSLKYRLTENWTPYASYGYGQKAGGINVSSGSAAKAGMDSLILKPERTHSWELGVQGTLIKDVATLTADVFHSRVNNFQTQGYDADTQQSYLLNAGSLVSRGVELGLGLKPLQGLTLNLSGMLNDARYTDYHDAVCPSEITATYCDLTGSRVFNAPRRVFVVDSRYDWTLANGYKPYVSGRYAYRSWTYGSVDDSIYNRISGYGVASFSVGVSDKVSNGTWDASLWVTNAFNKLYYTRLVTGSGVTTSYVGDPRTVGVTLKYTY